MYASNSRSYTHLILTLGIVRAYIMGFITSKYPGIYDIGRATHRQGPTAAMHHHPLLGDVFEASFLKMTKIPKPAYSRGLLSETLMWQLQLHSRSLATVYVTISTLVLGYTCRTYGAYRGRHRLVSASRGQNAS